MRKIIDHMHVLFRLGYRKASSHTFERSYRIGKAGPLAAETFADAKCRTQVFKVVASRKR